jgi:hypothetical protein
MKIFNNHILEQRSEKLSPQLTCQQKIAKGFQMKFSAQQPKIHRATSARSARNNREKSAKLTRISFQNIFYAIIS